MKYTMTTPCPKCPFRDDIRPYLRADRAEEIANSLIHSGFPCHKTTSFGDDGEHLPSKDELHCAGALIVLERMEQPSQMMRICERIGLYDASKLDMDAPVFESLDDWINAQEY